MYVPAQLELGRLVEVVDVVAGVVVEAEVAVVVNVVVNVDGASRL